MKSFLLILSLGLIYSLSAAQPAVVPDPDPHRFDEEISRFVQWDKKNSFPEDAILFVGSSSIRLWMTAESFPDLHVINRGFGGAHISDVNFFLESTVLKYFPRVIVFYAGDNDIAGAKTPDQVLEDYKFFVQNVLTNRSDTKILYLPIKPSIARWEFWPKMAQANSLIEEYCATSENLLYVDTAGPMLQLGSPPPADLFADDGLHLSPAGYQLWNGILAPVLNEVLRALPSPGRPRGLDLK